jgi:hypothetical protein
MPITIDQLDEKHARAALDILEADGGLAVYEGVVPQPRAEAYVLVYTAVQWPGQGEGQSFDGTTSTCVTRWYTHCVGATDQGSRTVANRVRQLLVNVRPTIPGRSCGFIQQEASPPPVRDQTTGVLVQDIAAVYILTTYPG